MIKLVLDSNVIISAIVFGGKPRKILNLIIEGRLTLCLSKAIIDEVLEILERKFKYTQNMLFAIKHELMLVSLIIEPDIEIKYIEEDEDDNKILECAVSANCDYIISGDRHLLSIKKYKATEIKSVSDFLIQLGIGSENQDENSGE